ncbi:hypothetical protein GSI_03652 [Ganoderma sinense ZZ0214-1]|uniref:DH domain-containing protein n=1 Tax=Ganoderma sinense ZZ0214-1 TaxID=1077348 RepID=A0A2G8SJJ9_9APHY|nr:hypothetical protein GSI_03652 [Ganoderma sinense ZZ0214-1]
MSQRPDKPLPLIPQSSIVITSSTSAQYEEQGEAMAKEDVVLPFADVLSRSVTPDPTRREYALLELLRSERTYVSDLVLLRDYQIPLASGRLSSMSNIWQGVDATIRQYLGVGPPVSDTDVGPVIPPGSSSGRPRPSTIASNVSAMSFGSIFTLRPMKTKDVNIVFSNIEELAAFSEEFLHQLESALGELIEGNEGEDFVGRLFLDFLPKMESLYETYVMNQPHALAHYHRLSKTFQFDVYFPRSQILAHKSSNAWDLPSLLIKPIQHLLHYPQLLAAILAQTPGTHHDKAALFEAHARMTEMTRGLNEKVVREVLAGTGLVDSSPAGDDALRTRKKSGLKVGLPGFVDLGRIGVPWAGAPNKAKDPVLPEVNPVAQAIKAGGERLRKYEEFMVAFTMQTMEWADDMRNLVASFDELVQRFARASSRFDIHAPHMALRKQLSKELPRYLTLLDMGMAACIRNFARIQSKFYANVRDRWRELWDSIRVDEETNEGVTETLRTWERRFSEADEQLHRLSILRDPQEEPTSSRHEKEENYSKPTVESFSHYFFLRPSRHTENQFLTSDTSTKYSHQDEDAARLPALYKCRVVRPYQPPDGATYQDIPFFTLKEGQVYEILAESACCCHGLQSENLISSLHR